MKTAVTIWAIIFLLAGLVTLCLCTKSAIEVGDIEGGDINAYAGYYRDEKTGEIEFINWPTGETPWFSWMPSWFMAVGLVVIGGGIWQVRGIWTGPEPEYAQNKIISDLKREGDLFLEDK